MRQIETTKERGRGKTGRSALPMLAVGAEELGSPKAALEGMVAIVGVLEEAQTRIRAGDWTKVRSIGSWPKTKRRYCRRESLHRWYCLW